MVAQILIQHGQQVFYPAVEEGIELSWSRAGSPGKLRFNCLSDRFLSVSEGDAVKLLVDGEDVFYGFVFSLRRTGDASHIISITAYDQLRYLKNKDSYNFVNKTASQIIRMIAEDFRLNLGDIADTEYVIQSLPEDDTSLFDIIGDALGETLRARTQLFVLYDKAGALTLQNINTMMLNLLIDADSTSGYTYTSSIDDKTYNQIKITYEDGDTGKRSVYITKDSAHINEWGLLQHTATVENPALGALKAEALLKLYNAKNRKLSLTDVLGDMRVRAGSSVVCRFNLGDVELQGYMLVEEVTHTFRESEHTMSMKLRGGSFGL